MENKNNSTKSVLVLIQYLLENRYCDIERVMKVAPKEIFEGKNNRRQIQLLIEAMDLEELIKDMGLNDYTNGSFNECIVNPEWFVWR